MRDSPRLAESWGNVYDPLVVLSYVAAKTSRAMLGTSVLILPYRNPVVTAKMFATLDQMSGGRAIIGAGAGWSESEFAALGEPYRERGARTTEYLEIFQACWAEGKSTFHGKFFDFEDMHVNPKPLQQPHPPIWVGGSSRASLRAGCQVRPGLGAHANARCQPLSTTWRSSKQPATALGGRNRR